jgi:ssDNA thymidine ADP-ribosyltransferase, DarT
LPGPVPNPTLIFHVTPIATLASIAQCGGLLSKNEVQRRGLAPANIAYENIQGRRSMKRVPCGPGGTLHDYVPFYFAPRSPMLFTINQGNVPGCDYRQGDIVHLVSDAQLIRDLARPFVFSDIHAALDYARFFDDLRDLDQVEWTIFFEPPQRDGYCIYWQNRHASHQHVCRKEIRQAEFLAHEVVPLAAISQIGVNTVQAEHRVRAALTGTGWTPEVQVRPGWYY